MSKQIATFGLGCFWRPQRFFTNVPGVSATLVGYTGGTTPNPTYEILGDHTESIQITFNPSKISYEELLQHFWQQHDATIPQKRQYRSVIFYHDDSQRSTAEKSKAAFEAERGATTTAIEYAGTFYPAEDYHQHYLRAHGIK